MIQTVNFKTKTIMIERKNPAGNEKYFPMAMDIGYSSIKDFTPNKICSFPYFATKVSDDTVQLIEPSKNDIQYRDENGTWYVGELSQMMLDKSDTSEGVSTFFGRNRWVSPMFKVLARTGLGLGMMSNSFGTAEGKIPVLQTGLPPSYAKGDAKLLREALAGRHEFEIKVGNREWKMFNFDLLQNNIYIMPQPQGSLLSLTFDANGRKVPDYNKFLGKDVKTLICDAGFGTTDFYDVRNGSAFAQNEGTKENLSMRRVFEETVNEIYRRYSVEIPIHTIQKYLQKGSFNTVKAGPSGIESTEVSFASILEEMNHKVCMEAIEYMVGTYNYLQDYNNLVMTGGTGAAWLNTVKSYFSKMETLKVFGANINDNIPPIFSNVRGYYYYLIQRLLAM